MTNLCIRCGRPTPDGYCCSGCAYRAGDQLHDTADMAPAARDIAHRTSRRGGGGASGKPGSSLPLDLGATARLDAVQNALTTWARWIVAERGIALPQPASLDEDVIAVAAKFLGGQVEWMRHREDAERFLLEVGHCHNVLSRVTNGRQPGRYAGPCGYIDDDGVQCREDVEESRPGARYAICRACGSRYDVDERQAWMRGEIEGYLARPVEIAGILLRLGQPIGYSTIAAYATKGQILAHGVDATGKPLYRIGDVIDIRLGAKGAKRGA